MTSENLTANTEENVLDDFYITENSIARIKELKQDNPDVFIRIMITSGGCAGHQYHILMDDYVGETDYVLRHGEENKIFVVIDKQSLEFLHNSTMDFSDGIEFGGFVIDNPNVSATCNCGNSFSCSGGFVMKKEDCKN